ncbi:Sec-independent protein translocase protein TatB [Acinetobacter soli]|uniref:Sec-independent protein translocase protein TatB n=1 Tax=Acinetobacter soli TaxID=487316 RepID=UPI00258AAC7A|nr:Sec-independent protein translocase protein TatB [uncultured Acinetobacter sp.]
MLDVGFGELFCFGIIALLVLGPDKLPVAARFAGRWYARAKRYISNIQNEIDRELKLSEFRKEMQDELDRLHSLEQSMQARLKEIEKASQEQRIHLAEQPEAACASQLKTTYILCHVPQHVVPFCTHQQPRRCERQNDVIFQHSSVELKIAV